MKKKGDKVSLFADKDTSIVLSKFLKEEWNIT